MRTEAIKAVHVIETDNGSEYYEVGHSGVTGIHWGTTPGLHCDLPTVRVVKNGQLHSEHPFHNCLGVYFDDPDFDEVDEKGAPL